MTTSASAKTTAAFRSAGRAAITSGVIGLVAYGFLWAFLITMISGGDEQTCRPLITTHDVGVLLQSLFMIPLVLTFGDIVGQRSPGARRSIVAMGVAALALTMVSLLLIVANVLAGPFFMLLQGLLGIWLVVVNRLVSGAFSRGLRWFGMVIGVGLMIAAVFPVGNFLFVDRLSARFPSTPCLRQGRSGRTRSSTASSPLGGSWASRHCRSGPRSSVASCSRWERCDHGRRY